MDLEPVLALAGVDATVLVQTVDTLDDTDSMLAADDRHRFIKAIVGWIPLTGARSAYAAGVLLYGQRPSARRVWQVVRTGS